VGAFTAGLREVRLWVGVMSCRSGFACSDGKGGPITIDHNPENWVLRGSKPSRGG
jgi:hypothetical protein